ncbi:MAG TPA: 50S ribosomal protein L15 [Cytophagaceae bacterium]|jgi:large subunit ribosomal protein L15|nr:50S ribosomal protein L15 [Cytophagaceae bacterium]
MKLNTLTPAKGSVKSEKRIGRGTGSGKGGTSTRGHKGAKSRSGYSSKIGFEGGQMPLYRRLPKFGFNNPNKVEYKAINLDTLQELASKAALTTITFDTLLQNGLCAKNDRVKILSRGELKTKVDVTVHAFSKAAIAAIEKAGGKATVL